MKRIIPVVFFLFLVSALFLKSRITPEVQVKEEDPSLTPSQPYLTPTLLQEVKAVKVTAEPTQVVTKKPVVQQQNVMPPRQTMTCLVTYPCTGSSFTYDLSSPENCRVMQQDAIANCQKWEAENSSNPFDVSKAIEEMQKAADYNPVLPSIGPLNATIHIDEPSPAPTVPVGYP